MPFFHKWCQLIEKRLANCMIGFCIKQLNACVLFRAVFCQVFDQNAPLAAASAEDDGGVGLEVPRQRQSEKGCFLFCLVRKLVDRLLIACVFCHSALAEERDKCVTHVSTAFDPELLWLSGSTWRGFAENNACKDAKDCGASSLKRHY